MLEKIFDPLGGGGVISTAKAIGRVLQLPLECDASKGMPDGKSSGVTETKSPPLMFSPSRANSLMPFVTTRFSSDAAATTSPPGQTQNENTPRPFSVWQESLYDVGGRP